MRDRYSTIDTESPIPRPQHSSPCALIAMSGGVDSTVAALLAIRSGLDCTGAMMKLRPGDDIEKSDAELAAEMLGIPFHVHDFSGAFAATIISRFISAYRNGSTPNPCIDCNRHIKFGLLMRVVKQLGADYLITGHYARTEKDANGRHLLRKGTDFAKDQSYVLYALSQEQLSYAYFPLGGLIKQQVRDIAAEAGLQKTSQRESQDICFVPDGDYAGFIKEFTGVTPNQGRFVDQDGNYLGPNKGVEYYTIGQRRGLGLAMPHPLYVLEIRAEDNTVVVGKNEMLYSRSMLIRDINLIPVDKLDSSIKAQVRIRYRHSEQPATVSQVDDDTIFITFDEPQRAITKGQSAVIYDGDYVIGGGTIV